MPGARRRTAKKHDAEGECDFKKAFLIVVQAAHKGVKSGQSGFSCVAGVSGMIFELHIGEASQSVTVWRRLDET